MLPWATKASQLWEKRNDTQSFLGSIRGSSLSGTQWAGLVVSILLAIVGALILLESQEEGSRRAKQRRKPKMRLSVSCPAIYRVRSKDCLLSLSPIPEGSPLAGKDLQRHESYHSFTSLATAGDAEFF